MRTARHPTTILLAATLVALTGAAAPLGTSAMSSPQATKETRDTQLQSSASRLLDKPQFKDVQVVVNSDIVTLFGFVDLFAYKQEAEKRVHRIKGTLGIRNNIAVRSANLDDEQIQQKLVQKLTYDRVGYGTTAFNAIAVEVHGGIVTLSGHAYGPADKDSAISVVSYTPGVQDVIDEVMVDPVSSMDDRIRIAVARAVYGYPSLNRYAIDPARPIRISVQNGHVTLFGEVDSKTDRDVAFLQANSVPDVFTVTNKLEVAKGGETREK